MKPCLLLISAFAIALSGFSQSENTSPDYATLIEAYRQLAQQHPEKTKLIELGGSDSGKPIHLLLIDGRGAFIPQDPGQVTLFVNNGIHPGEPAGINASLQFAADLLSQPLPDHVLYCIVPVYNVGGMLNRGSTSRANQNGPAEYGFRGNAKNLDLNRDFIKQDSKNARTLTAALQKYRPHIFIDTHTSNGADYQHVMTLIPTMDEHLSPMMASYLKRDLTPYLYAAMDTAGYPMVPYVNSVGETPDLGLVEFPDYPRYSTGYAALFNIIGYMPEVHMLKPFDTRVAAMKAFLESVNAFMTERGLALQTVRQVADADTKSNKEVTLAWRLDTTSFELIPFRGFESGRRASEISGAERLYYDRNKPYTRNIRYYDSWQPAVSVTLPPYYVIPRAWEEVIERLQISGVKLQQLTADTELKVKGYYISDYKTVSEPYEGHYLHYDTQVRETFFKQQFHAGDYVVATDQIANKFIANVLNPLGPDSYFNWNFFDACLGQKEYYSAYVFEDLAPEILRRNKRLATSFENLKKSDAKFAADPKAQLDYIYTHSEYYEPTHKLLPVFELREAEGLPLSPAEK